MANILGDALKFGKEFPGCLKQLSNTSGFVSMHNTTSRNAAISITLYKAFRTYALLLAGLTKNAAFSQTKDQSMIAEIYNEDQNKTDACVVKRTGAVYAAEYDGTVMSRYTLGRNARGGSVIFLALMPQILSDKEAETLFTDIYDQLILDPELVDFSDYRSDFNVSLAQLCDNVYQRCIRKGTSADINLGSIPTSGTVKALTSAHVKNSNLMPVDVHSYGTFRIFEGNTNGISAKNTTYTPETFKGAFVINPNRVLTKEEENMVPVLNKEWIIPYEAEKICNHIKKTTCLYEPSRTFYLEGFAGSGKTSIATIVAAGLNLPKVVYTCHAGTEMFDLIGQVMPASTHEKKDFFTIIKENNYPSIEDIEFNLEESYKRLTGCDLPLGMDEAGCISLLIDKVLQKKSKQEFSYVESDFIKAIKYGWVCEIQEPASVLQQGVLVGLNSLLEPNGIITLPTGEQIQRHPDTVIIFTANPSSYKGCDTLNQSIISRANMKLRVEANDVNTMAKKAMAVTGFKDLRIATEMADIVNRISRYLIENEIDDGVCGQRELKDWMQAVMVEGEDRILDTAIDTIIGKATEDIDEKEVIIDGFLKTSSFA